MRRARPLLAVLAALALPLAAGCDRARTAAAADARQPADTTFAGTVARLSEPGGFFDTDNLVTNETSYLHVLPALARHAGTGGAYVGVGPEQSFSYVAELRPEVAFVIDVRRDNLLQHLWYRAHFELAENRAAFLLRLAGRAVPRDVAAFTGRPLDAVLALADSAPPDPAPAATRERVLARVRTYGVPLDAADERTIGRIHDTFAREGLGLRFTSHGRAPRAHYPALREIVAAVDRGGTPASWLATEERFRAVQALERAGRVIPVVGDLAGPHALAAIGREAARRGLVVRALYASNVEFYLMRAGTFDAFARTVAALPRDRHSVIVRSCFGGACGPSHPDALPGHVPVQMLQAMDDFARLAASGALRTYGDLATRGLLPPG